MGENEVAPVDYPTKQVAGRKIILLGVLGNAFLAALKFTVGFFAGSAALVADAVHSLSDVFHTFITFLFLKIAEKPADDEHSLGHGNAETLGAMIVCSVMTVAGVFIIIEALRYYFEDFSGRKPDIAAVFVAAIAVLTKVILSLLTKRAGGKAKSPILRAAAVDHWQDALASSIVLLALVGSELGVVWLDVLGAVLIGLFIAIKSLFMLKQNTSILLGAVPNKAELVEQITRILREEKAVKEFHNLKLWQTGSWIHLTLDVAIDGEMTVRQAHNIVGELAKKISVLNANVGDVQIHTDPWVQGRIEDITDNQKFHIPSGKFPPIIREEE